MSNLLKGDSPPLQCYHPVYCSSPGGIICLPTVCKMAGEGVTNKALSCEGIEEWKGVTIEYGEVVEINCYPSSVVSKNSAPRNAREN